VAQRPVAFYFKQLDDTQGIVAEVRRLAALDRACRESLPLALRPHASVGGCHNGRIKIYASSGAVAAKLRQVAPRLTAGLRARGIEVTAIDVQVQAGIGKTAIGEGPRRALSGAAVNDLEALRDALAPSPLKDAVERLLRQAARDPEKSA
jgi:hypothetical protein